jgi:hypothetical protein
VCGGARKTDSKMNSNLRNGVAVVWLGGSAEGFSDSYGSNAWFVQVMICASMPKTNGLCCGLRWWYNVLRVLGGSTERFVSHVSVVCQFCFTWLRSDWCWLPLGKVLRMMSRFVWCRDVGCDDC